MNDKYRDPIHGFIEVTPEENKIINSIPFQRLRNIKQLAMTYLVFHGAEHTRFGHSLGVMHLASKAFKSAVSKQPEFFTDKKKLWYEQILRLIALTHDLGHAPFSHASEKIFSNGMEHEHYTEKIIKETEIAGYIQEIGDKFKKEYGEQYDITPELICNIYLGRLPGENSEFTFLKNFVDSELDCDKMDYLLRDSYYCGVNYGKYDVERLIDKLTIYIEEGGNPRLAIQYGGIQAFEEFVLARYFMFIQVYFHRTRRYFDIIFGNVLEKLLLNGTYPTNVQEYLEYDDCKILQMMKEKCSEIQECKNILNRVVYPRIYNTPTHAQKSDRENFRLIRNQLFKEFGTDDFLVDSADKMPHKIPTKTEVEDEKAIVIINDMKRCSTISDESLIIRNLTEEINIQRIYASPFISDKAKKFVQNTFENIKE